MLTLTENASTLIKNLADQAAAAEDAGLRISAGGPRRLHRSGV